MDWTDRANHNWVPPTPGVHVCAGIIRVTGEFGVCAGSRGLSGISLANERVGSFWVPGQTGAKVKLTLPQNIGKQYTTSVNMCK